MKWNLNDPPRFASLKIIEEIPPFQSPIEFEFDPEVNVFIGPNATGKSTLLKILSPEVQDFGNLNILSPEVQDFGNLPNEKFLISVGGDNWLDLYTDDHRWIPPGFPQQRGQTKVNHGTVPVVYLPPVRAVAPPYPEEFAADDAHPENRYEGFYVNRPAKIRGFVELGLVNYDAESSVARDSWFQLVNQELAQGTPPKRVDSGEAMRLLDAYPFTTFDCNRVYYALQKLAAEDESRAGSGRSAAAAVAEATRACLRDICPEVIQGDLANYPVEVPLSGGYTTVRGNFGMGAHIAGEDEAVYVGNLSTGTQGLFWWICYLALNMACHYSVSDGVDADGRSLRWWDQPAILLIDEIENHLHPTWQRRVIPALRKHFPGLQIFATTHSPFVVAGLKRGQVHRLYREKGVIKTDQLTEEEKERKLVGWTVEEILQEFMDVEDPTDEETAMAAATLRWLQERFPPDDPHYLASDWVRDKILRGLRDNPERLPGEEQALRWLSENQPDSQSDVTAENENQPDSQSSATTKDPTAKEWWLTTIEWLRSATGPNLEDWGPIAARTDRFMEEIRRVADHGIDEEPEDEEG